MSEQALHQAIQCHQKGDVRNAQRLYLEVLRSQPNQPQALRNLGLIALETGHIEEAIDLYQRALAQQPNMAVWKSELAQVYSRSGEPVAARQQLLGALKIEPSNSLYLYLLGNLYTDLGQVEDAVDAYRLALQHNPSQARVYSALAHLAATGDFQFTDTERRELERQANNPYLKADDLNHIHFALANLAQGDKDYPTAYAHFVEANRLKKACTTQWQRFDPQQLFDELAQLRQIFTSEFLSQRQGWGSESEVPVFIVGMPRTGTTLIERVLAGHPGVVGRGELMHIKSIARDSLRLKTQQTYPDNLRVMTADDARQLARHYLQRVVGKDRQALRVVDKMPTNYQMLGLIYLLFPQARIIHTRRDPMDTLWSCFTRNLSARFSNDLNDLVAMYRSYRETMDFWRAALPEQKVLDLDYETLVTDFENQAHGLIEFLGLDWHPDCLRYDQQQAQIGTASKMQVRKPIYTTAVFAWEKYASQLAPLRQQLAPYYSAASSQS